MGTDRWWRNGWVLVALGCASQPSWRDQLAADSPCYRVVLNDGLDEESTDELNDLYGCLNATGNFDSLQLTMSSLESTSPDGVPAGIEVARLVNHLPNADVDVFGLAGTAVDLLQAEDRPIDEILDVVLEIDYGVPAARVREEGFDLNDSAALEAGLLIPLREDLPIYAQILREEALYVRIGDTLASPELPRIASFAAQVLDTSDPDVSGAIERLPQDLGSAVFATRNTSNNQWSGATDDSLRDVATVLLVNEAQLMKDLAPSANAILGDEQLRNALADRLISWHDRGQLQPLLSEVALLASVDTDGNSLQDGEDSALYAFLRLLHDANRPMSCSLDLWVTDLNVDLGNVAVFILETIADFDPGAAQTGLGLLGGILGWDISQGLANTIADSGVCPVITTQMVSDLQVIDVMSESRFDHLMLVFVEAMDTLEAGGGNDSRVDAVADLTEVLIDHGAVHPVEELVRDVDGEPLVDDVLTLVPVLDDPEAFGLDSDAYTLRELLEVASGLFAEDNGELSFEPWLPLIGPLVDRDALWVTLGRAATLLDDEQSQLSRIVAILPPLLAVDPELESAQGLAPLLGDPELAEPLLRVVETDGVADALLATEGTAEFPEPPLAFLGRMMVGGTLDDLLGMIDRVFSALDEEEV